MGLEKACCERSQPLVAPPLPQVKSASRRRGFMKRSLCGIRKLE